MKGQLYYNLLYSFTPRKPRLMARLAANTLKAKLFSRKLLRYVDVCVSTQCNLRCTHCFASSLADSSPPLSVDQWGDIARQCMRLGCVSFGITGGEPLMYDNLIPLVKRLAPQKNLITVNSNGTLLTESLAGQLYRAGVDVLQFSMDSYDPAEHDFFRKQAGAHTSLLGAIDIALANRLKVTLVCTVSHHSIRSKGVTGVVEFAGRRGLLVILSRATPAGEWLGRKDVLLSKSDQQYMYEMARRNAHVRTDMDTNLGPYGCSAATEKLYVTPSGNVIPCPFMHISFGSVRNHPVKTIRDRMLSIPRLRSYAHTCHTAEDTDFIDGVLSATFRRKSVVNWRECFHHHRAAGEKAHCRI